MRQARPRPRLHAGRNCRVLDGANVLRRRGWHLRNLGLPLPPLHARETSVSHARLSPGPLLRHPLSVAAVSYRRWCADSHCPLPQGRPRRFFRVRSTCRPRVDPRGGAPHPRMVQLLSCRPHAAAAHSGARATAWVCDGAPQTTDRAPRRVTGQRQRNCPGLATCDVATALAVFIGAETIRSTARRVITTWHFATVNPYR